MFDADDMYVVPKKIEKQFGVYLDTFRRVALYNFEIQEYKEVAASTIHVA
jgi:hypothetical protein